MKRRDFLHSALTAAAATAVTATRSASAAEQAHAGRDWYELRTYSLKTAKQPVLDDYLSKAFIPTMARLGAGPVGVFSEANGGDALLVHVLTVYSSPDQFASVAAKLATDADYLKAAADFLAAPASDPVYERIESSLLLAFEGMPRLMKPDTGKPRLMNMRIYESHNERAALKKMEMFNTGEFAVFQRAKMPVVFCAETIVGPRMPNLTYMLVFPDEAGRKEGWSHFGKNDPDWKRFRSMHEYDDKEIVSKITNKILTPAAYSGI
jgi:hypothetical protein